jgi:hypothetical protein
MAQHDYIIANQSGLAFRQDLNNALAAIVSQNSGAAEPSTTYAYQPWADTTTGLLKIRNASNNAWITVGTLADANLGLLPTTGGTLTGNLTLNAQSDLRFADADSSNWVAFEAPAIVGANVTWTLPAADGTANYPLVTDGSGVLSWSQIQAAALASNAVTTAKIAGGAVTNAKLGSGLVLKVQHFVDAGSSTTSGSYTNANNSFFSYTPVSTSSTLILIASFGAQINNVTSVNAQSFHAIGESSSVIGSGYAHRSFSASGGIGLQSLACIQVDLANTSLTTRSFQMMHAANGAGQTASTTSIRMTIMEVAN